MMLGGKRLLITGADGFVGRWLVRAARAAGTPVVAAIMPGADPPKEWSSVEGSIEVVRANLLDDGDVQRLRLIVIAPPIIHLAQQLPHPLLKLRRPTIRPLCGAQPLHRIGQMCRVGRLPIHIHAPCRARSRLGRLHLTWFNRPDLRRVGAAVGQQRVIEPLGLRGHSRAGQKRQRAASAAEALHQELAHRRQKRKYRNLPLLGPIDYLNQRIR